MNGLSPDKVWWTSADIADARLPGMPSTRQGVEKLARKDGWRGSSFSKPREGRGGGWLYNWQLFPVSAQQRLLAISVEPDTPKRKGRDDAWTWFDGLSDGPKATAAKRLKAVQDVLTLESAGTTRNLAVERTAKPLGVSARTIWNWLSMVEGVRQDDFLPYLAPRHNAAPKKGTRAECSPEFFEFLKGDYLRLEKPSFTSSYRRSVAFAKSAGHKTLPETTMRRHLFAQVPATVRTLAREGNDALKALYPPQTRDKASLAALEVVNADYHKFDVWVKWPVTGGKSEFEIIRPQMVAFQDVYSGRVLSWRLDRNPNKSGVALALGDMIERFGIPEHMLLDNGREFANKFLTGQAQTRNRFKIKDDDIPGLLVTLGVKVHWATPYSGQSKPIERAFRDMCDMIAKDPRFAGAYTGNKPDAQPENYGSRAIDLSLFLSVVAEGIEEHNARTGRRSESANGRSFNETFDTSYAVSTIRKATPEQQRLWLMGAEGIKADRKTGVVRFMGNEYWSAWMHGIAGDKIVARFDPEDLWSGIHVYSLKGPYLGHAGCKLKAGFFDVDAGRDHARLRRQFIKSQKASLEAVRKMRVIEVAEQLPTLQTPENKAPGAKIIAPVFTKPFKPAPAKANRAVEDEHQAIIALFDSKTAQPPKPKEDSALDRFTKALSIEERLENGGETAREDRRWLSLYQTTPEYLGQLSLLEEFGPEMFTETKK